MRNTLTRSGVVLPVTDYGSMSVEELVDHFIDEGGLAQFIQIQQKGIPRGDWDWRILARDVGAFTKGHLTFSPGYLASLYEMQLERNQEKT